MTDAPEVPTDEPSQDGSGSQQKAHSGPRKPNTCGGCTNTWMGHTCAHCSVCHETFGSVRSFDLHRKGSRCADPAAMGLKRNVRKKCWSLPYTGPAWPKKETGGIAVTWEAATFNQPLPGGGGPFIRSGTDGP
jgi:hypothetical protein